LLAHGNECCTHEFFFIVVSKQISKIPFIAILIFLPFSYFSKFQIFPFMIQTKQQVA
jgi:hypothetical protein